MLKHQVCQSIKQQIQSAGWKAAGRNMALFAVVMAIVPTRAETFVTLAACGYMHLLGGFSLLVLTSIVSTNKLYPVQVKSQNDLISGMEGQMFDAGGLLGGTLRRINTMMAKGGSRHMCYLVAFIVFVFVFIWYILKHSTKGR